MKFYKDWQLRSKILFAVIVPFITCVLLTFPLIVFFLINNIEKEEKAIADEVTYSAALEIEAKIGSLASHVKILASSYAKTGEGERISLQHLIRAMEEIAKNTSFPREVWSFMEAESSVQSKRGQEVAETTTLSWMREADNWNFKEAKALGNVDDSWLYRRMGRIKEDVIFASLDPEEGLTGTPRNISIVSPIIDKDSNFRGAIGANVEINMLSAILDYLKQYSANRAFIVTQDNRLTISTEREDSDIAGDLNDFDYYMDKASKDGYWSEELNLAMNKVYRVVVPVNFKSHGKKWLVFAEFPIEQAVRGIKKKLSIIGAIMAISFIIGISISLITARSITSRITAVTSALSQISAGKHATAIPLNSSGDEIGLMIDAAVIFKAKSEELVIAKQQAEVANKAKSDFLTHMSHELRTPMHSILSYSQLGCRKVGKNDATLHKYFSNIDQSAQRLLKLINNLLNLSKLEAGKTELHISKSNIMKSIQKAVAELKPLLQEKHIDFRLENKAASVMFEYDEEKIMQVLINILSNAIKFSSYNSVIKAVIEDMEVKNGRQFICISIYDQGCGIPDSELSLIFNKFTQSSNTNKAGGGSGLGLSIAASIVACHHGTIWAENNEEGGAVIRISLPKEFIHYKQSQEEI